MTHLPTLHTLWHRTDPDTSREAAVGHAASGARETNVIRAVRLVESHPGLTSREYAEIAPPDMDLTEVRRRLTDARNAGLIVNGDKRRCSVAGTRQMTWRVA